MNYTKPAHSTVISSWFPFRLPSWCLVLFSPVDWFTSAAQHKDDVTAGNKPEWSLEKELEEVMASSDDWVRRLRIGSKTAGKTVLQVEETENEKVRTIQDTDSKVHDAYALTCVCWLILNWYSSFFILLILFSLTQLSTMM